MVGTAVFFTGEKASLSIQIQRRRRPGCHDSVRQGVHAWASHKCISSLVGEEGATFPRARLEGRGDGVATVLQAGKGPRPSSKTTVTSDGASDNECVIEVHPFYP